MGQNRGLSIVGGHAIYQNGTWYGGFKGEDKIYEQHLRDGFRIWQDPAWGYQVLALSGGHSRPNLPAVQSGQVTNSEGEGMLEFARDQGLYTNQPEVLVESYARDSFENVFFSMLCFFYKFEYWPSHVGVVSWNFKALRFYAIACGLNLGNGKFRFHGSGDPYGQKTLETIVADNAKYDASIVWAKTKPELLDPLHRDPKDFGEKRLGRMPSGENNNAYLNDVKRTYDSSFATTGQRGEVGIVIDMVEDITPGPGWRYAAQFFSW